MTVREYIGARYVPLFSDPIQWDITLNYEPLTVVLNEGSSYVSRQAVPAGVSLDNDDYWILWADYNAQIEAYREEVALYNGRISDLEDGLPIADFDSTNTVKAAIDAVDSDVSDLEDALPIADFDSVNTVKAAIDAVESDVSDLEGVLPIADFDSVNTVKAAIDNADNEITKLQNRKTVYKYTPVCYLDAVNGDDDTAVISDRAYPFKTLNAAIEAAKALGNDYYFSFLNTGTYVLSYRIFVGSVVHFVIADEDTLTGTIVINMDSNIVGDLYFYSTHINACGTDLCNLIFNLGNRMLEIENGSLHSWHCTYNCQQVLLVQSYGNFRYDVFNCYVRTFYGALRISADSVINNQGSTQALYGMLSTIRIDGDVLGIKRNTSNPDIEAISVNSCRLLWNAGTYRGDATSGYTKFIDCRGTLLQMGTAFQALLDATCPNASNLTSYTLRMTTTVTIP